MVQESELLLVLRRAGNEGCLETLASLVKLPSVMSRALMSWKPGRMGRNLGEGEQCSPRGARVSEPWGSAGVGGDPDPEAWGVWTRVEMRVEGGLWGPTLLFPPSLLREALSSASCSH